MGKVFSSVMVRPLKNWNVSNRAERVLEKDKPTPAPKHPSTKHQIAEFQRDNPELLEAQKLKNQSLLDNLQNLVVEPERFGQIVRTSNALPQERGRQVDPEFGYQEPVIMPKGKCSVKQAFEFLCSHQVEPEVFTSRRIAKDYKLEAAQVSDILKHFRMLNMQFPVKPSDVETSPMVGAGTVSALLGWRKSKGEDNKKDSEEETEAEPETTTESKPSR